MRKTAGLLSILALLLTAAPGFAAGGTVLRPTITGSRIPPGYIQYKGPDHYSLAKYKAQNHLSSAMNNLIIKQESGPQFHNCSGFLSLPCFNSWFITGYRNSVYTYAMLGGSPKAGGTTNISNEVIPLESQLIGPDGQTIIYDFDPTAPQDLGLSDISLATQGPIWNSNSFPGGGGLAPDTGQFVDTTIRASFNGVKASNWHVKLSPPTFPGVGKYTALLSFNNGDWACFTGELPPCTSFPVVNIDSMSNIFEQILSPAHENPPSTELPIIVTDFVTAFIPGGGCCVLGFHSAQPGNEGGNSVLVWTWGTYIAQSSNNPFNPFGFDTFVLTHEVSELYHDPFVQNGGTLIAAWVDGSVSFAQGNLETGDAVEAMADVDSDYHIPMTTSGGNYTYHGQTEALLEWFTRNPTSTPCDSPNCGPGVYSWPRTATLNSGHDPAGWMYGEGPAGFFFGPPF